MKKLKKVLDNLFPIVAFLLIGDIIVDTSAVEIPLWVDYIRVVIYIFLILISIWGMWDFIKKRK
jgi:membrane protein implicated in regulation of membrane protease activity